MWVLDVWKLIEAILSAFFKNLFKWGQKQSEKPETMTDADKPPKQMLDDWEAYVDTELRNRGMRDKDGHGSP